MLAHLTHWPKLSRPGKKQNKGATSSQSATNLRFERSSSSQTPKKTTSSGQIEVSSFATLPPRFRTRAQTYSPEVRSLKSRTGSSISLTPDDVYKTEPDNMQMTFSSPRHFMRRRALGQSELQGDLSYSKVAKQNSLEDNEVSVSLEDESGIRMKDTAVAREVMSLRERLDFLFFKNNVFLSHELEDYHITATDSTGSSIPVDLDSPSTRYISYHISIKPGRKKSDTEKTFRTVQDCLAYFDVHGLVELPLNPAEDEDSYRLPRVQPLEPIVGSWSELPILVSLKNTLDEKELKQQQAIWELIYTEHSHLRQLETIINLFMQCLELIRRAKVLNEDGYHNMFGYMEDLYHAHEQFWTWTLEPCLEKVYETGEPLDVNAIIDRFPEFGSHFEIYEQHCALENINLRFLKEASQSQDFMAYLKWCEAQPQCNRQLLKEFLVIPMQRLTKYPLLIKAISNKTEDLCIKQSLIGIWGEIHEFVQSVNNGIRAQEETERVRDAMNRIAAYNVVDIPSEFKELIHKYTHLDLLAPMPNVEVDKPRVLMLEGNLKYRDINTRMVVHVFLFTDMLLITKPYRRGLEKYAVVKQPYKITSLVLHPLEAGSFCVVVLNEFYVVVSWFVLKANSPEVAEEWREQISAAQQFYTEAVEKKEQNWQLLQNLRSERILDGIDPSLSANLSQSLISINSFGNGRPWSTALSGSIESILSVGNRDSMESNHLSLSRTRSADPESHKRSTPSLPRRLGGSADCAVSSLVLSSSSPKSPRSLERASSLGILLEKHDKSTMMTISESKLLSTSLTKPHRSISEGSRSDLQDVEELSEGESIPKIGPVVHIDESRPLQELNVSQGSTVSIISDDSGTESGESPTCIGDSFPVRQNPPIVTNGEERLKKRREVVIPVENGSGGLFRGEKLVCDFDVKSSSSSESLPFKTCFQDTSPSEPIFLSPTHDLSSSRNATASNRGGSNRSKEHIDNHLDTSQNTVETTSPLESVPFVSPSHTIIPVPSRTKERKSSNESDNHIQTDSSPSPNLEIVECKIFKKDKKHHRSLSESALNLPTTFNQSSFSVTLVPSPNQQSLGSSSLLEDDNETMVEESSIKNAESNSLLAEGDEEARRLSATSSYSVSSSSDTILFQCDSSKEPAEEIRCTNNSDPKVVENDAQSSEIENNAPKSDNSHFSPPRDRSKSSLSKYSSSFPQYCDEIQPRLSSKSVPASPSRNAPPQSPKNASPQRGSNNVTPVHERITHKSVRELLQMFESKESINASSEHVGLSPSHQPPRPTASMSPSRQRTKMATVAESVQSDPTVGDAAAVHVSSLKSQGRENETEKHSKDGARSVQDSDNCSSDLNPPSNLPAANSSTEKISTCLDANKRVRSTDASSATERQSKLAKNNTKLYSPPVANKKNLQQLHFETEKISSSASSKMQGGSKTAGPPSVSPRPTRRVSASPRLSSTLSRSKPETSASARFTSDKGCNVTVQSSPTVPSKPTNKVHTKQAIKVTSHASNSAPTHTIIKINKYKSNPLHTKQTVSNAKTVAMGHLPSATSHSVTPRGSKSLELINDSTSQPRKASSAAVTTTCKSVKKSPTPKQNSIINTNKTSSPSSSPSTCKRVAQGSKSPKSVPKLFEHHSEDKKVTKLEPTKQIDSLSPFSRESSRPIRKRKVTPSHLRRFQVSSSNSCPSSPTTTRPSLQRLGPSHQSLNNSPILTKHSTSVLSEGKEAHKSSIKQQTGVVHSPKGKSAVSSAVTNVQGALHKTSLHLRLNSNTNNNNNNNNNNSEELKNAHQHSFPRNLSFNKSPRHDLSPLITTRRSTIKGAIASVHRDHESDQDDMNHDGLLSPPPCPLRQSSTVSIRPNSHKEYNTHTTPTTSSATCTSNSHANKVLRTHSVDSVGSVRCTSVSPDHSPRNIDDVEHFLFSPVSCLKRSATVSSGTSPLHYSQPRVTSGLSSLIHKHKRSPHEWQNFGLSWSQQSKTSKENGRPQLQHMNSVSFRSGSAAGGSRSGHGGRRGAISPL